MFAPAPPTSKPVARRLYSPVALFALLTLLTLWRVGEMAFNGLNLSFDEAQYWLWSLTPDWGYFSKPPMVAWMIGATTAVFGHAEWAVKLGAPVANAGTAGLIYFLGGRLYDRQVGFWAALLFATIPGIAYSSMVITVDPFLLFFWAGAMIALDRALTEKSRFWWVMLGLALGLGMLSKYAMLFFLICMVIYLLVVPAYRVVFRTVDPWIAFALCGLLYLPNYLWNKNHAFLTYAHTKSNANVSGFALHIDKMAEFIGSQFGVFGPLSFAVALWLLIRAVRTAREDQRQGFLLAFMLPVALIMVTQSLLSRANANWAAPIYVAGSVLVVGWVSVHGRWWIVRASVMLHLALAVVVYNYDAVLPLFGQELTAKNDPAKRIRGWDRVGARLSAIKARHPGVRLMFDDRKVMAPLIYYVTPTPLDSVMFNSDGRDTNHYELAFDTARQVGEDFLLVTDEPDGLHMCDYFTAILSVETIRIPVHSDFEVTVRVYLAQGFRGYSGEKHPHPPESLCSRKK